MKQNKINHLIISAIASCFYLFIIFLILGTMSVPLFDTPFMMSLYIVPFIVIIYSIFYEKINNLLTNKITIAVIISIPVLLFFFSLFKTANKIDTNKKLDEDILEEGLEIYENADDLLDNEDFNLDNKTEDIIYKIEGDLILKKDEDGNIRQFKPLNKDEMTSCVYKVYELNEGYLLACTMNENINYYSKEAKDYSIYYKLNIPTKYLINIDGYEIKEMDISDEVIYKEYNFDDEIYVIEKLYSVINLYKQFSEDKYILVKSYDLKEEVSKEKEIRSWYDTKYKITFITKNFEKYVATFELNKDLTLKINYEKQ